jgi:hypothetical protein
MKIRMMRSARKANRLRDWFRQTELPLQTHTKNARLWLERFRTGFSPFTEQRYYAAAIAVASSTPTNRLRDLREHRRFGQHSPVLPRM